jgi:hypothetical protein
MSESETTAPEVDIDIGRVARAPVGGENDTSIKNSTRMVDPIRPVLEDYVEEVINKKDITNVEHGNLREDSEQRDRIERLHTTDNEEEYLDLVYITAKNLNDRMPDGAGIGSLFVYQVDLSGTRLPEQGVRAVSIVKMDTEVDRRAYEDEDDNIREIDEANAFPQSSRLQKGAIYPAQDIPPHSRVGDVKIYQRSPSDYFRLFFECDVRIPSSLDESRQVLKTSGSMLDDELGRQLTSEDVSEIIEHRDPETGYVDKESLVSAFQSISDGEIGEDELEQYFGSGELERVNAEADKFPKYTKVVVETSNGKIKIKYPIAASSSVQPSESGNTFQIQGNNTEYKYVNK